MRKMTRRVVPITGVADAPALAFRFHRLRQGVGGDIGSRIRKAIAKANLQSFEAVWRNGFRQTTSSLRPIKAPDDLENRKLRVPFRGRSA